MSAHTTAFSHLVAGLEPKLFFTLLALVLIVGGVGWYARRRLQTHLPARLAAELAAWTLCAVSGLSVLVGTVLAPAFTEAAGAAALRPHWGSALAQGLGWTLQLPLLQVSVPFLLITASLGAIFAASSEASEATYRWLARGAAAATVLLTMVLGWGLVSMLAQQMSMRRLFL